MTCTPRPTSLSPLTLLGCALVLLVPAPGCPRGDDDDFAVVDDDDDDSVGDDDDTVDDDDDTVGDDDDTVDDDDDTVDDDDSAEEPTTLSGVVLGFLSKGPLPGVSVSLMGADSPTEDTTDAAGLFSLAFPLSEGESAEVLALGPAGFLDATLNIQRDLAEDLVLALFTRSKEEQIFPEDFGVPYDPTRSNLFIEFLDDFAGAQVAIDSSSLGSWVFNSDDDLVPGDTPPVGSSQTQVLFVNVEPGPTTITVTAPSGTSCAGPAQVNARADTYVNVWFLCE